jgi:asparagine synthase (glutamine-hydrolysing)
MFPVETYHALTRQRADMATSPNGRLMSAIRDGARQQGVRVLLSGIGGDEWLGGSFYHAADLFRSMRWIALASYARAMAAFPEFDLPPASPAIVVWPHLSRTTRRRIKRAIGRDGVPIWISRDFARRVALADRLYPVDPDLPFPTIAQRNIYRGMTCGSAIHHIEDDERAAAECGLEMRQPYADRRVMEFGLAIPEELRWRGGSRKFVLRQAMRGLVPAEVVERRTSPNGGGTFVPTLRALADEGLWERPAVEREGWVLPGAARTFYDRVLARQAAGDPDYTDEVWPLWIVAAVELWMREVADRPADDDEEQTCEMTTALTSGT